MDKEFHPLFKRVSERINLKGCSSPEEIDGRIKSRIDVCKERRKTLRERGVFSKALNNTIWQLKKLIGHGFGERAINEAVARPRELEGLTLRFGSAKAKEILLHRRHSRLRRERQLLRNRRSLR
jgi:hypothetical protein